MPLVSMLLIPATSYVSGVHVFIPAPGCAATGHAPDVCSTDSGCWFTPGAHVPGYQGLLLVADPGISWVHLRPFSGFCFCYPLVLFDACYWSQFLVSSGSATGLFLDVAPSTSWFWPWLASATCSWYFMFLTLVSCWMLLMVTPGSSCPSNDNAQSCGHACILLSLLHLAFMLWLFMKLWPGTGKMKTKESLRLCTSVWSVQTWSTTKSQATLFFCFHIKIDIWLLALVVVSTARIK